MKYNVGDMFVDSFGSSDTVSYIYRFDCYLGYYWFTHCEGSERSDYNMTEEELDITLADISCFKHYPVVKV
jgi:hypothetical protein